MSQIVCYDSMGELLRTMFQWDTNQTITIKGAEVPPYPVFHFANRFSKEALVVTPEETGGTDLTVKVPNILLQSAETIFAYLYYETDNDAYKTKHVIQIPVAPRAKPSDYEYSDNIDYISVAAISTRLNEIIHQMTDESTSELAPEVIDIRIGSDGTVYQTAGEAVRSQITDLKGAIASDISGFVFETANDKYTSGKYHNVEYRVTGNTVKLNGTANGGFRLKLSGANASISNKIQDDWKNESLGLIIGHQYVMCVQYVSGSGSKVGIGINGSSSETLWVDVDPSISTPNATFFSEIFTANATNSSLLYVFTTTNRTHSNLIFRFNLIDITASFSLLNVIDNASGGDNNALHSYYFDNDYINERMNTIIDIRAASSINSESFVWFTDPHYYRPTATQQENGMQSAQIMEYMRKQVNTRWIFCGGDMLRGTLTKAVCREYFKKTRSYLEPIYSDLFMALGNHEYNNTGSNAENELSTPELYEMFVKHQEMMFDSYSEKGDYTFTNDAQHVRYFVIGCTRTGVLFTQTIAWLAEALTHVENGYHVIIVSHIGMKTDGSHEIMSEFVPVCDIIDAVNTRTSYTYSGTTYNYSGVNGEIVCALTGHTHFDGYVITNSGVPIIETMSDKSFTDQSSDAGLREVRTIGTIGEQSVNYVLIDFDAHKIHMIRIGGSYIGAAFDSTTGKIYDAEAGTGTEYTGSEWVAYSPYKDQHFDYTSHLN